MAPPDQHIGFAERLFREPVLGIVERGQPEDQLRRLAQSFRQGAVDALGPVVEQGVAAPLVGDGATLKRFLAKATRRLTHERIVRTYHVFRERGNYYIVMEYVEGQTLACVIDELKELQTNEEDLVDSESISQPTHMVVMGRSGINKNFFTGSVTNYVLNNISNAAIWIVP